MICEETFMVGQRRGNANLLPICYTLGATHVFAVLQLFSFNKQTMSKNSLPLRMWSRGHTSGLAGCIFLSYVVSSVAVKRLGPEISL